MFFCDEETFSESNLPKAAAEEATKIRGVFDEPVHDKQE